MCRDDTKIPEVLNQKRQMKIKVTNNKKITIKNSRYILKAKLIKGNLVPTYMKNNQFN